MGFTFLFLPFFRGRKSLSAVKELQAFGFTEKHGTFGLLDTTLFCRNEIRNKTSVCDVLQSGASNVSETLHTRYFLEPFSLPDFQSTGEHGAGRRIMLLHQTAFTNINCKLQLSYCTGQVTHTERATRLGNKLCGLFRASPSPRSRAAQLCQRPAASIAQFKHREATGCKEGPFALEFAPTRRKLLTLKEAMQPAWFPNLFHRI